MKVFLDTNVLISGIFFPGNEALLLSLPNLELITSEVAVKELKEVASRKFSSFKVESKRVALHEIERALGDLRIVEEKEGRKCLGEASRFVQGENDRKILAAVFYANPDYFITGDRHFHTAPIKSRINVKYAREFLRELKIT